MSNIFILFFTTAIAFVFHSIIEKHMIQRIHQLYNQLFYYIYYTTSSSSSKDSDDSDDESDVCAVCLSQILKGENVRTLPNCNHKYHFDCIGAWLKNHTTCPLCRNIIINDEQQQQHHHLQHNEVEEGVDESPKGSAGVPPDGSSELELSEDAGRSGSEAAANVVDDECADYTDVAGLTKEAIVGKRFRTEEGAYEFYKKFGKFHGFAIRKGDSGKDDKGNLIRRRFFCNRAGLREQKHYERCDRKREHKPETRTNCDAKLSIYVDKVSGLWKVRSVILEHNHEVTPAPMIHMIPSYRSMSESAKAQVSGLHSHGVPTSKILGYMAGQAGGYSFVGFSKKDAYNYVDKSNRAKIIDGDSNAAIGYLEGKAISDPMSTARYVVTEDMMLANLLWADGGSRIDYQHFGDVLAFDSTYKKDKYKRPLVIFSGSNNHKKITIFGFGILLDETVASYKWMLENFYEVMCKKKPSVVVTDGDEAMKSAIKSVFPDATHRLCAWHLEKNVTSNVRSEGLRQLFNKWLYSDMEPEEFEDDWAAAMEEFGTGNRVWFRDTYEKRKMWASAYLKDKFCAGFRTTSRCEGINSNVKKFVKSRFSLLEMLQSLEMMVREYRNNELEAQFKTVNAFPVLTTDLEALERYAATVYTREVFYDVKKEMEGLVNVNFVSKVRVLTTMVYTVEGYQDPGRHVEVMFERNSEKMRCGCGLWIKRGFPCRHMFFVMKHEHLTVIPERLLLKRWMKDAKSVRHYGEISEEGSERAFLLRHGALHSASQRLLFAGAKSDALFRQTVAALNKLCEELEGPSNPTRTPDRCKDNAGCVRDPAIVKTKGAPRVPRKQGGRKQKCTTCRKPRHTKRHCKSLDGEDGGEGIGAEFTSQGSSRTHKGTRSTPKTRSSLSKRKGRMDETVEGESSAGTSAMQEVDQNEGSSSSESDPMLKEMLKQVSSLSERLMSQLSQF